MWPLPPFRGPPTLADSDFDSVSLGLEITFDGTVASRSRGTGPTPLQRALGDRVRERRHELELTQAGLAERAHIHYTYVGALETGTRNPSVDLVARLARALELDLGVLLKGLQDLPGRSGVT